MSESAQYVAFREFARATIALEVMKATQPLQEEIRNLKTQLETRSAPQVIEGPAGKDGRDGVNGKDGRDGKDGVPGERGVDGIATREEIEEVVSRAVADVQTRALVDYHKGTYVRGESYTRGSIVAWDGSSWVADKDTNAVPGVAPEWKLIAKKGREGRDRPR